MFPESSEVSVLQLCACSLSPHTKPDLISAHLWKSELWPEKPLPGPNDVERIAGDRRRMASNLHAKTDTRGLVHRLWDTIIEWKGLFCRPEWRENTHTHRAQLTAYTGNCWDVRVMSASMFIVFTDILKQTRAHPHAHTWRNQLSLFLHIVFLTK